jgi:two-component system LytT family sensor kinase
MNPDRLHNRVPWFWILHVSGWLAYTGTSAIFTYRGDWTDISQLFLFALPYVVGFGVCIPLRFFYKRIHFHERPLKYSIPMAVSASFVGSNLWMGLAVVISLFMNQLQNAPLTFIQIYFVNVLSGGITLLGWTFLYFGIKTRIEWKEQEKRKEKAYSLAQDAQLQMLRYQLNPHFLFNSMNSIRALIDEDETKAREMITELSEFLRYSLDSKEYSNVPLKNEIEAIRHYLAIQKKRYEAKLEVIYDIEPQAGEFPVLSFLIHPLVENAIKYGMQTSSMPLTVHLKTKLFNGGLLIEVNNSGKWIEPASDEDQMRDGTGTGLDNVRSRLQNAFPGRHRFEFFEKEGLVHVQLEIRGLTERSGEKKL